MRKFNHLSAVWMLIMLISGCGTVGNLYTYKGNGFLYTDKVEPLTHHYHTIQIAQADRKASGSIKQLSYQYYTVLWDINAIGEIAKKAGILTIHYADLETQSILFGLWSRHRVHVYGTAEAPETPGLAEVKP